MKKLFLIALIIAFISTVNAVPMMINYQGQVEVAGTPFSNAGYFKFALVDDPDSPTESYWSNDGTSVAGSEPAAAVSIDVVNGLYNVILGETGGMNPLNGTEFSSDAVYLRVWFDDGSNGFQLLSPDQRIVSMGFTMRAAIADDADTVDGMEGSDLEESADIDAEEAARIAADAAKVDKSGDTMTGPLIFNGVTTDIKTGTDQHLVLEPGRDYNVGISTDTPDEKLDVQGKIHASRGMTVGSATDDGVHVESAGDNGVAVLTSTNDGIYVYSAADDGVSVHTAGTPSTTNLSSDANGFDIAGAEGNGLYVGRADKSGLFVESAGSDGVEIKSATYNGVRINSTGESGVNIQNTGADGVYINTCVDDGLDIRSPGRYGMNIAFSVNHGIYVYHSGGDGINIHSADYDGVDADTTNTNHEWGLYTPDKIYAGTSLSTNIISSHVKNTGASRLERGDLVCLAGGYDENVLGENGASIPHVRRAGSGNSDSVIGVVEYRVKIREEVRETDATVAKSFRFSEGEIETGDYLSIIVFGPADVKFPEHEQISAGETVTVSSTGNIRKRRETEVNGLILTETIGTVGKAIENNDGSGILKIFVNCL